MLGPAGIRGNRCQIGAETDPKADSSPGDGAISAFPLIRLRRDLEPTALPGSIPRRCPAPAGVDASPQERAAGRHDLGVELRLRVVKSGITMAQQTELVDDLAGDLEGSRPKCAGRSWATLASPKGGSTWR